LRFLQTTNGIIYSGICKTPPTTIWCPEIVQTNVGHHL
jgi:hypothetical protein